MAELTRVGRVDRRRRRWPTPSQTKTVRVRDGVVAATDGPFAEAKEQFAGYSSSTCESEERALEIAARWPDARYCAMEVRADHGRLPAMEM